MKKFYKFWLPVIIWAGIIFTFSAIPNLKSGLKEDYILRKIAHALEFALLMFLLFRAMKSEGIGIGRAILYSFVIALFYAFSDEFHQLYVKGRQGSLRDVGIDTIGILIAAGLCYIKSSKSPTQ